MIDMVSGTNLVGMHFSLLMFLHASSIVLSVGDWPFVCFFHD